MRSADSLEKTLMLGKIEGRRRRGRQRVLWLDGITDSMDMGLSGLWGQEYWSGVPLPSPNLRLQPFQYMVDLQSYLGKMHVTVNFLRVKGVKGKSTTS